MIIIETPAPPTLERLVLVPADAVSRTASEPTLNVHTSAARDATPDDLLRAGYVPRDRYDNAQERIDHFAAEIARLAAQPAPGTLAHLRADLRDAAKLAGLVGTTAGYAWQGHERHVHRLELAEAVAISEQLGTPESLREIARLEARGLS